MYGPFDFLSGGAAIGIGAAILIPNVLTHRAEDAVGDDGGVDMGGDAPGGTGPEVKLKQIHQACHIYYYDHEGRFPASLGALYPDYVMATSTFTVNGAQIDAAAIDTGSDFVLAAGATMEKGAGILAYERVVTGRTTILAVTVDGELKSFTPAEIEAALKP
jgi:hypothetical protein